MWGVLCLVLPLVLCAVPGDRVTQLPGYPGKMPSAVYSGYVRVTSANQTFYTHYMFTESQGDPTSDPLVLWQQGGPGSSGLGYGYFAELGPYRLTADSMTNTSGGIPQPYLNPHSFDHISNLLIFEHPPGTGFSYCADSQGRVIQCYWNDQTQAIAFYDTLVAWYNMYSEYQSHKLHIIGESYAGLLIPYLVDQIIQHSSGVPYRQLQSFAVGNGCPGTSGSTPQRRGTCNGPYGNYDTQHVMELAYGHSGISRELWNNLQRSCGFPCKAPTWSESCNGPWNSECRQYMDEFNRQVGDFNIYNFYDNCGDGNQYNHNEYQKRLLGDRHTGGEIYPCGTGTAAVAWCNNPTVRNGIHMKQQTFYGRPWGLQAGNGFRYDHYTGSSYDLYPNLVKHFPATIYNGDVDACVPYNSNEDWVVSLVSQQRYTVLSDWTPWLINKVPAGYVTKYNTGSSGAFTFITIKDSGHMVPQYQPERAFAFFQKWLQGGTW